MEELHRETSDSLELLVLFYKHRRFIIITTFTTTILAVLISLFLIPQKFTSEAVIYPTPSNSEEAIIENPSFGFEGHSNQLLQVLKSNTLQDRLIAKFDLATYYEIDTTRIDWYSRLVRKMEEDITFERTPYYSLSIQASTTSPELSSQIVNYIVEEVNSIVQEIFIENINSTRIAYESEYLEKEIATRSLLDSLIFLKQYNTQQALSHLNNQIEETNKEIVRLRKRLEEIKTTHKIYAYDEQLRLLTNQVTTASANYTTARSQYKELSQVLSERDTSLLKLKGEMAGAREIADTATMQLSILQTVKSEYSELELFLDKALSQYAHLKRQRQDLENAYEPTVGSAGLGKLQAELNFSQDQLQNYRARYERAQEKVKNKLPSIYVISRGRPNYKKSSPSHSKNLLFGFGIGLLLSTSWILISYRWQQLKPRLKALDS